MKNIKQNKKDMRCIRRQKSYIYKSNSGSILHTDATSPNVIVRITTVPKRQSTGCLIQAMIIGYEIIKKRNVVDVLPNTSPVNNIPTGTG